MVKVGHVGTHVAAVMMLREGPNILVHWAKVIPATLHMSFCHKLILRVQFVTSFELLYSMALTAGKISVCLLYLRLFPQRWFKAAVFSVIVFQVAWAITVIVIAFAQCTPMGKQWHPRIPGHCINQVAYNGYISLPNIFSDAVVIVLPMPIIWKLQLSMSQKLALTSIFLIGSISMIASCVRTNLFLNTNAFSDPTWASVTLISWTTAEPGIVLIAACLPILRPLIVKFFNIGVLGKTDQASGYNSGGLGDKNSQVLSPGMRPSQRNSEFRRIDDSTSLKNHISRTSRPSFSGAWPDPESDAVPLNSIGVTHEVSWSSVKA